MKAISLHQPWASFIAAGLKPHETRSWPPPRWLIGQRIAIHAAKKPAFSGDRDWATRLNIAELPLGAVVCAAVLAGAYQCGPWTGPEPTVQVRIATRRPGSAELMPDNRLRPDVFGDYSEGRWAWRLTDIERFDPPIPARGGQRFWNWPGP